MTPLPQHVDISKLAPGTRLIVETDRSVWNFTVRDAQRLLVDVQGTDAIVRGKPPVIGQLTDAVEPIENGRVLKGHLVKGWKFLMTFANVILVGNPVVTTLVEGKGWHYEAIE